VEKAKLITGLEVVAHRWAPLTARTLSMIVLSARARGKTQVMKGLLGPRMAES
jgi:hypothetical protein